MSKLTTLDPPDLSAVPAYARPFMRAFQSIVIGKAQRTARKRNEESLAELENLLDTLADTRKKVEMGNLTRGLPIFNAAQFACIVQYDVSILGHDALLTKNRFRRKLYCRLLALTLIESVEDLSQMLGWKFRQVVSRIYNDPEIDERTKAITTDMAAFTQKHSKMLREIRLTVSAHRDHDAAQQLRVIEELDCAAILQVGAEFVVQNKAVLALLFDLMTIADSKFLYLKMWQEKSGPKR